MPQTIALAAFYAGASVATANTILAVSSVVLNTALSVGISLAASLIFAPKPPKAPRPQDVQVSVRANLSPRLRFYGRAKASGNWLFGGTKQGAFYKVLAVCQGEIDGVEQIFVDDKEYLFNPNIPLVEQKYKGKITLDTRLGTDDQTAFEFLTSRLPEYTTEHRGRGIAMIMACFAGAKQEDFYSIYPKSVDTVVQWVFRGVKVKNPVTGVTAWSDNAAAVVFDYMTHEDGMRIPRAALETPQALAGWQSAYNKAAATYALKAGGSEPRYRLWGPYSFEERPGDVIARMLTSCDGRLYPTQDGGLAMDIGDWYEPTVVIDSSAITGFSGLAKGNDVLEAANVIRASYTEPSVTDWTGDAEPWRNEDGILERGEIAAETNLTMTPSHSQARRLMKIAAYRANPAWKGSFSLNMRGLAAVGERLIRLQLPEFGLNEVMEVLDLQFDIGEDGVLRGVSVELASLPAAAYEWDPAQEEGVAPVETPYESASTIPLPSGFIVNVNRLNVGSTLVPFGVVSFDAPPSESLKVEARYRAIASDSWIPIAVSNNALSAQTSALSDGTAHEFQARHVSAAGTVGEWTPSITITPTADEAAPGLVTNVLGVGASGEAQISWRTPNSGNYSRTIVKRNTTNNLSTAVQASVIYGPANSEVSYNDGGLAPANYYYWLIAVNASSVESAAVATGVLTVT